MAIKNPYKARHYQVGGAVQPIPQNLVGIQQAAAPTWEQLHTGHQADIDQAYIQQLANTGQITAAQEQEAVASLGQRYNQEREGRTEQQVYEDRFGPQGYTPGEFGSLDDYQPADLGLFGQTTTGAVLGGVADYQLDRQREAVDAGTGLTLSSPHGYPVTVHHGPLGLVVTGQTEGVPDQVYIDQALRQGLPTRQTLIATGQIQPGPQDRVTGAIRTGTDALGLTQPVDPITGVDPTLPGGSFGGPGGFVGANDVVYDTAAEAAASLDRRDAQQAALANPTNQAAQATARSLGAAHVHTDDDGQQHTVPAGRSAVTDSRGNAVTSASDGSVVTSRNSGGGDSGGGGGDSGGK